VAGSIHSDGFAGLICPRPTATEAMVEAAMFDSKRLEMRVEDMV